MIFSPKFTVSNGFTGPNLLICQGTLFLPGENWVWKKERKNGRKEGKQKKEKKLWSSQNFLEEILLKQLAALEVGDDCV